MRSMIIAVAVVALSVSLIGCKQETPAPKATTTTIAVPGGVTTTTVAPAK